ncbi:craniofacial development protein 2-like [Plakobranchus ocellatus]|uniref:Craniofacial development protein 2-like n=1 Tax=Plakobranchus ocellatus TaxID=259542 RepID=A0AAV4CKQ3_9GAST|nr:craniofacial development protein 2-like [Plakobranchus ocellatus]
MIGQHKGGRIFQGKMGIPLEVIFRQGRTEESPNTKGLAFLVHKDIKDYIESFDKHSDRISCKIKLQGESLQLIEAYAPTTEYDDADVEIFFEELENAMDPKCKYKVIIGDFNSKIGVKEADKENEWIGPFGIGERNERGERLIDFCVANKLYTRDVRKETGKGA